MRFRCVVFDMLLVGVGILTLFFGPAAAQAPAGGAARAPGSTAVRAPAAKAEANLAQVMRGILFPNSNVIFFSQSNNPANVKPADEPSAATDPLSDTYGGWTAVENSALALAESANLITIPGRLCSNGRPVPLQNADWGKFVGGLRQAGMNAYKAAQSKNQDKMLDAADAVVTACQNCHERYREKPGGIAARCM
jgi:hypothetical protein